MTSSPLLVIIPALFSLAASIFFGWVVLSHRNEIFTKDRIRQRWQGKPIWQVVGLIILTPVALVGGWIAGQNGPELLFRFMSPVLLILFAFLLLRRVRKTGGNG